MDDQDKILNTSTKQDEDAGNPVVGPNRLLQGLDAFTGDGKIDAVEGESTDGESDTEVEYKITTSIAEFASSVDVSTELAVESLFGTYSLSAKAKFVKQLELTEKSVVVLVNYKHSIQHSAVNTTLRKTVTPPPVPLEKSKLLNFFDNYGNKYVTQISKGGQYIAAYVFRSASTEEQHKIVSELNGKGIYAGNDIQSSTIAAIDSVRKENTVSVSFSQTLIGYSKISLPSSEEDIPDFINKVLPKQERPDATLSYIYNDYFEVPELTREMFSPITDSYALFKEQCEPYIEKLAALKSTSNRIKKTYKAYGYTLDSTLTDTIEKTKTAEAALREAAKKIAQTPTADLPSLPDTSIIEIGLPTINVEGPISKEAIAGTSDGGLTIADFSRDQILDGVIFYSSIVKEKYGCIIELDSNYATWNNGTPQNKINIPHGVGDPNKPWSSPDLLPAGHFVTKLKGYSSPPGGPNYWSNNAAAVEMWITGDDLSGPPSRVIGTVSSNSAEGLSWEPKIDEDKKTYEVFVGWSGNCGDLINQLGPQILKFSPATWHPLD